MFSIRSSVRLLVSFKIWDNGQAPSLSTGGTLSSMSGGPHSRVDDQCEPALLPDGEPMALVVAVCRSSLDRYRSTIATSRALSEYLRYSRSCTAAFAKS